MPYSAQGSSSGCRISSAGRDSSPVPYSLQYNITTYLQGYWAYFDTVCSSTVPSARPRWSFLLDRLCAILHLGSGRSVRRTGSSGHLAPLGGLSGDEVTFRAGSVGRRLSEEAGNLAC